MDSSTSTAPEPSETLPAERDDEVPRLAQGDTVGRFVVLETVGEGGMGLVVAAYDPVLDRKVALKLLRQELTPADGGTEARTRLKREAQAMARLRHPNVVAVFEVGEHEGQVFLAMEYVPGGTLAEWAKAQRDKPGAWRKIVDAYVQAGHGLVAAHEQGLIHRDFKPANILVDGDRFQVTDFGISSPVAARGDESDGAKNNKTEDVTLTRTGLLMGTAPFMAPERHRSEPATAATDQFAFCVSLFEALFGRRPFGGKNSTAVAHAILENKLDPPPPRSDVPEFVREAIIRGLSGKPEKRWPSMAALLSTLSAPETADVGRRTRLFIGTLLGVSFIVLPILSATYRVPFDMTTYSGTIAQSAAFLGLFLVLAYWARESMWATPRNRQIFAAVTTLLVLQIPFELGQSAAGIPLVDSHVLHLFFWGAATAMYGALADRRYLILAGCYLIAYRIGLSWPEHFAWISGAASGCFVIAALLTNLDQGKLRIWKQA